MNMYGTGSYKFMQRIPGLNPGRREPEAFSEDDVKYKSCFGFKVANWAHVYGGITIVALMVKLLLIYFCLPPTHFLSIADRATAAAELGLAVVITVGLYTAIRLLNMGPAILAVFAGMAMVGLAFVMLFLTFLYLPHMVPFQVVVITATKSTNDTLAIGASTTIKSPVIVQGVSAGAIVANIFFVVAARAIPFILMCELMTVVRKVCRYIRNKSPAAFRDGIEAKHMAEFRMRLQDSNLTE